MSNGNADSVIWPALAPRVMAYLERWPVETHGTILRFAKLSADTGQALLLPDPESFICWLRCDLDELGPFLELDAGAASRLSSLRTGSVLYVAEWRVVQGERQAYRLLDQLARDLGCEWVAGWRRGQFRVKRADTWAERAKR